MSEPPKIDRARVEDVAQKLMSVLRDDYFGRPRSRDNTLAHLNALAVAIAPILAATKLDPPATEFFRTALRDNIREVGVDAPLPTWLASSDELADALAESVKLQSHYAELLNAYDGGQRRVFATPEEWVARLREIGNG